jgi:hypothetical protein
LLRCCGHIAIAIAVEFAPESTNPGGKPFIWSRAALSENPGKAGKKIRAIKERGFCFMMRADKKLMICPI